MFFRLALIVLASSFSLHAAEAAEQPRHASDATGSDDPFVAEVLPFLNKYCGDCHTGEYAQSGVDLTKLVTHAEAQRNPSRWNQIRGLIELGAMPPPDHDPLPSPADREAMADRIYQLVNRIECGMDNDAGRVTIRRLNAFEYDNTIHDLFAIDLRPSELVGFPSDDVGNGFNNQGEVLNVSPLLLEKYLNAAEEISNRIIEEDLTRIKQSEAPEEIDKNPDKATKLDGPPRLLTVWPSEQQTSREAAAELFDRLLPRIYRRPAESWEVERVVSLVEAAMARGLDYPQAIGVGLQAALVSPHFLFRVEPATSDATDATRTQQPVSQFALANRLSYFLLASMPDGDLMRAAADDQLIEADDLESQASRLLSQQGARNLVEGFFAQWLGLGGLQEASPNERKFRAWNSKLRAAMREETIRVCEEMVVKDYSLLDLLQTEFTYVNPRLAELYGITFEGHDPETLFREGPGFPYDKRREKTSRRTGLYRMEDRWRKVPLPEGRRGILTHASILTMTSNPSSTSPVKRGKWVLETLLGDPPPPAPPSVPGLEETAAGAEDLPIRKQLELHREDPSCASCHQRMDPIGFALQNFDSMGIWRDENDGHPIDASGKLDDKPFDGPMDLIEILSDSEEKIARNFAERLMVYALGRGLRPADHCAIDQIVQQAGEKEYRISAFIYGVVRSDPFRMRRSSIPSTTARNPSSNARTSHR